MESVYAKSPSKWSQYMESVYAKSPSKWSQYMQRVQDERLTWRRARESSGFP